MPGIFLEAGVAMGGSACVITGTKKLDRESWLYDVFEMLPPAAEHDDAKALQWQLMTNLVVFSLS